MVQAFLLAANNYSILSYVEMHVVEPSYFLVRGVASTPRTGG